MHLPAKSPIPRAAAALFLAILLFHAPAWGEDLAEPAPLQPWERTAVEMVLLHLAGGNDGWWERLAADAALADLPREEALAEIRARLGEPEGATWILQSPVGRYPDHVVSFWIETSAGIEDLVQLRFVEERNEWKLLDVRCLAEPSRLFAGVSFWKSPVAEAGAGVVGVCSLLCLLAPGRRRRAGLGVLLLLSCGGPRPGGPDASGPEETIRIADLRLARSGGVTTVDDDSLRMGVAAQWRAQHRLLRNDLQGADEALAEVSDDPAAAPLAALLRARLAVARGRGDAAQEAWASFLHQGADSDALRLEAARSLMALGRDAEARSTLRWAASGGSRSAEVWVELARLTIVEQEEGEEAERFLRRAWQLEPLPRELIFADPLLATIAGRGSVVSLFAVSRAMEPRVEPSTGVGEPLALPPDAQGWVRGDHLEIDLAGGARLDLPGGAALRSADLPVEDAATARERREDEVLVALDELRPVHATITQARLRSRWMTASTALERRHRFADLIDLTEGVGEVAEQAPPSLLRARARALLREDRTKEAQQILVGLGHANMEQGRRDPVLYYELGELVAAAGDVDLALRLTERAHAIAPWLGIDQRVRQLRLESQLVGDYRGVESHGFRLRFPRSTEAKYVDVLPRVLAAERERIGRWIPGTTEPIEVHLFPLVPFLKAFSSNVLVLGLFDGRVRVPFADLPSLHPKLVSILSHELAHAMITEATHDNAPRWFHEGLAAHVQMAQTGLNPYPDLVGTDRILAFPLVDSVLEGFGGSALVGLAYEEAAWILHFIETKWGLRGIHRMLDAYADGLDTEKAVSRALGRDLESFESELRAWAVRDAPASWPTELVRYDQDWNPYFQRAADRSDPAPNDLALGRRPAASAGGAGRLAERMKAWHATYEEMVRPTRSLVGTVVKTYRQGRATEDPTSACDDLVRAVSALLAHPTALEPPDARVRGPLRRAFDELASMSRSCRQGEDAAVRARLDAFERELGRAAQLLRGYGLRP